MWTLLLVACLQASPPPAQGCADCHGSPASAAPPTALGGGTATSERGVGAHQVHLLAPSGISAPVACAECHLVPTATDAPGHVDDAWPAEVGWAQGTLAGEGAAPWDAAAGTCTVYCHGATLGIAASPPWTEVGAGLGCASCHGFPPAAPHPAASDCGGCHAGGGASTPEGHVDGVLQLAGGTPDTGDTGGGPGLTCTSCHGAGTDPSPPPDTSGSSDTTRVSVGAHAAHVDGTANSAPVPCADCHPVPTAMDHADGATDLVFSGRAQQTVWDAGSATCSGSRCHDRGGSAADPVWTVVSGAPLACDGCHGEPPGGGHPPNPNCSNAGCHDGAYVSGALDPAQHVDGGVDF